MKKFINFIGKNIKFYLYETKNTPNISPTPAPTGPEENSSDETYDLDYFYREKEEGDDKRSGIEKHITTILKDPSRIDSSLRLTRKSNFQEFHFGMSPTQGERARGKTDFTSRIIDTESQETIARAHELKLGRDSRIISPFIDSVLKELQDIAETKTVRAKVSDSQAKTIADKIRDHYRESMKQRHGELHDGEIPETYVSVTNPKDIEDHTKCTIHPDPTINERLHKMIMDHPGVSMTNKRIILQRLHLIHETVEGKQSDITTHYHIGEEKKENEHPLSIPYSVQNFSDVFSPGIKVMLKNNNRYEVKQHDGIWYVVNSARLIDEKGSPLPTSAALNLSKKTGKITNKKHENEEGAKEIARNLNRQGITIDFRRKNKGT